MRLLKNTNKWLLLGAICGFLIISGALYYTSKIEPKQKLDNLESFSSTTTSIVLPNKIPIYTNSSTAGCSKDDGGYNSTHTCTFNSKQFYTFNGSYKEEAQKVRDYIQEQGFTFKNENSKQLFESHISNKNIEGNLSNGTPLLADFINEDKHIELRLSIGDKKRLNPQGPTGLTAEIYSSLSDEQLMTILSFSRANQ